MNKPIQVPIADIVFDRELMANDDLSELEKHISDHGQKQPVLLLSDMTLADGLRRLKVHEQLGFETVKAIISDNLEDSLAVIEKTRKHGIAAKPLSARRIWELFHVLHKQQEERSRQLRRRQVGLPRGDRVAVVADRARAVFSKALGYEGDSLLTASVGIYNALAKNTDPEKQPALEAIVAQLEAGDITIYKARGDVARLDRKEMPGYIVKVDEQREAFTAALAQLSGATKGLLRLGEVNPAITQAELTLYLKGMEESRRDLQRFITILKKRAR